MTGYRTIDGLDVWPTISQGAVSPRTELVYNIELLRAGLRIVRLGHPARVHAAVRDVSLASLVAEAPEQKLLRDTARRFLDREVAPRVADAEARGAFPRDLYPKLAEVGFVGATVKAEHGGHGLDFTSYLVLVEELADLVHLALRDHLAGKLRPDALAEAQASAEASVRPYSSLLIAPEA